MSRKHLFELKLPKQRATRHLSVVLAQTTSVHHPFVVALYYHPDKFAPNGSYGDGEYYTNIEDARDCFIQLATKWMLFSPGVYEDYPKWHAQQKLAEKVG